MADDTTEPADIGPADTEPAPTFRQALGVRGYRGLFGSQLLSLLGDRAAAVALAVLIYARTGSALLSGSVFALQILPHMFAAPLAVIADRYDRRTVMVVCDLLRCALVLLMVVPHVPLVVLLALLGVITLCEVPFDAARGAVQPDLLGERLFPVGMALTSMVQQGSQVIGAVAGGALLLVLTPCSCLLLDAATFVISATLLLTHLDRQPVPGAATPADAEEADAGEADGPAGVPPARRGLVAGVVADVTEAVVLVRATPGLSRPMLLAFLLAAACVAPEGLAVSLGGSAGYGSLTVGLLVAAVPAGSVLGAAVAGRLSEQVRARAVPLLAALTLVALVPSAVVTNPVLLIGLWTLAGVGATAVLFSCTALFQLTPPGLRGRVGGLLNSGLMLAQGGVVLAAGALAGHVSPQAVITVLAELGAVGFITFVATTPRPAVRIDVVAPAAALPPVPVLVTDLPGPRRPAEDLRAPAA